MMLSQHTMDAMLEKAGVSRMQSDNDLHGPTNMHNLLELVQKEQDIYNIVFHELIRQVLSMNVILEKWMLNLLYCRSAFIVWRGESYWLS